MVVRPRALSDRRHAAAERLARSVERELADLRLGGARFCVAVEPMDRPASSRRPTRVEYRVDHVEFESPPRADEPRPMARVASGGELARIALALKTVLSRAETRPTLIFDEIDVGVGGRTAPVVGEKLWRVASGGHQVLCVTHMPQVAAYADRHYRGGPNAEGATPSLPDDPQRGRRAGRNAGRHRHRRCTRKRPRAARSRSRALEEDALGRRV